MLTSEKESKNKEQDITWLALKLKQTSLGNRIMITEACLF